MSRIDGLIERLCPDGVDYKSLENVGRVSRGKRVTKKDLLQNGEYPVFQNSLIPLGYYSECNYPKGTVFVICAGAASQIGYSSSDFWAADDCSCIVCPDNLLPRFLYHFLKNNQQYLLSKVRKASIPRLSKGVIEQLRIPVPPMEIQEEIVRILDSFTELKAELEVELEAEFGARAQQYGYYRDRFVDSPLIDARNIASISLGNICEKPMYGSGAKAVDGNPASDIRYIRITDITENGTLGHDWKTASSVDQKYLLKQGDILFARSGATAGKTIQYDIAMGKAIFAGYLIRFRVNSEEFLPRFVYHCVNSTRYWNWLDHVKGGGAQPNVSAKDYASFLIPVLPLEEQRRIVSILDKFDALVNDLSPGIPAEIEARRKQYEYYRDKLLTFKEKPSD